MTKRGNLKSYAFRLAPHQGLKRAIISFAKQNHITAGCMITCVGSVEQLHLRFANQEKGVTKKGRYEIISLAGTFSRSSAHLHLAVADKAGKLSGGHLLDGTLIYTTAEIVVGALPDMEFTRKQDNTYGYLELEIRRKRSSRKNK
jgi:uncharacterized protein